MGREVVAGRRTSAEERETFGVRSRQGLVAVRGRQALVAVRGRQAPASCRQALLTLRGHPMEAKVGPELALQGARQVQVFHRLLGVLHDGAQDTHGCAHLAMYTQVAAGHTVQRTRCMPSQFRGSGNASWHPLPKMNQTTDASWREVFL